MRQTEWSEVGRQWLVHRSVEMWEREKRVVVVVLAVTVVAMEELMRVSVSFSVVCVLA